MKFVDRPSLSATCRLHWRRLDGVHYARHTGLMEAGCGRWSVPGRRRAPAEKIAEYAVAWVLKN